MIHFGSPGKPINARPGPIENSFPYLKSLGLDASEVQFVRGVYLSEEKAQILGKAAKENNMSMSVHAPFYINLGSKDEAIIEKSKERILKSAQRGALFGAKSIVFHAGFYTIENAAERICQEILELADQVKGTKLAPETMGNMSKFGKLDELYDLAKHKNVRLCVDWCHLHALGGGALKKKSDFDEVLDNIKSNLGKRAIDELHCHFSGVEYTQKGEKKHLPIDSKEPDFKLLARALYERNPKDMTIICESPMLEFDAVKMKKMFESLSK